MKEEYIYGIVILAGGKGTRMGNVEKAMLKYGQRTFISILEEEFSSFHYRYISTNHREVAEGTGFQPIPDEVSNLGPMGGVYTVLKKTSCDALFVLPCDMPFFSKELMQHLINLHQNEPVIYYVEKEGEEIIREYPLCGIYTKACLPVIQDLITEKIFTMGQVLERAGGKKIEIPKERKNKNSFININTIEDFQSL